MLRDSNDQVAVPDDIEDWVESRMRQVPNTPGHREELGVRFGIVTGRRIQDRQGNASTDRTGGRPRQVDSSIGSAKRPKADHRVDLIAATKRSAD